MSRITCINTDRQVELRQHLGAPQYVVEVSSFIWNSSQTAVRPWRGKPWIRPETLSATKEGAVRKYIGLSGQKSYEALKVAKLIRVVRVHLFWEPK